MGFEFILRIIFFTAFTYPCIISPVIILGYCTARKRWQAIFFSILFALFYAIAGYCFLNPKSDPDLVRYLQILQSYKGKSLIESFNTNYSNLYVVDILFHIVTLLGDDQLLPAISSFIFYAILFYILVDYKLQVNLSNRHFITYLCFSVFSVNFGSIVNGIRWPIAFIVFILATYRELFRKKKNLFTYLLYMTAILLHFSILALVCIRLLLLLHNKRIIICSSFIMLWIPQILAVLSQSLGKIHTSSYLLKQIQYFINRGNMYFKWVDGGWATTVRNSGYYTVEKIYYLFITALFALALFALYKRRKNNIALLAPQGYIFVFSYLILTIVSFSIASHAYIRFIIPAVPLFCTVFFKLWTDPGINFKWKFLGEFIFWGLSLMGIIINLYFLNMMIDVFQYFSSIFTFSPLFNL